MFSDKEIQDAVYEFLDAYFEEINEVVVFEEHFIKKHSLIEPTADYFKLKRFLTTAIRNLKDIDERLLSGTLLKLYEDVMELYDFFQKFSSYNSISNVVYDRDFLSALKPYQDLVAQINKYVALRNNFEVKMRSFDDQVRKLELQKDMNEEHRKIYKETKDKYAELIGFYADARDKVIELNGEMAGMSEMFKKVFFSEFDNVKNNFLNRLIKIINIKSYYLDKLLWSRAEQSILIRKFFTDSKVDGDYDTKTFIKYYLRNINVGQTKNTNWHVYLRDILKNLE